MPLYDYECEDCLTRFELKRSFEDAAEARCPNCAGKASRLYTPVPIIFYRSGFYSTDSRNGGSEDRKEDGTLCPSGACSAE